jgi:hypothetical protein
MFLRIVVSAKRDLHAVKADRVAASKLAGKII